MDFRNIFRQIGILASGLLMLIGCDHQIRPPLKIGTNKWIGYESLFMAQHLGFFKDHSIKLVEMASATDVARSLRNESLFDNAQIAGKIIDVLVTRPSIIQLHSDALQTLVSAHFQALSLIHQRDPEAVDLMSAHLGVPPENVLTQLKSIDAPGLSENQRLLMGDEPRLKSSMHDLTSLMNDRQLLFKPIDTDLLVDGSFLPLEASSIHPLDS